MGQIVIAIVIFGAFTIAAGLVYGVYLLLNPTRTASDRLRDYRGEDEPEDDINILIDQSNDDGGNALNRMLGQTSAEDRSIMRRKLLQAGYKHKNGLEIFNFTRVALAIGLPLILLPTATGLGAMYGGGLVLGACLGGFFLPALLVENNITKRKNELLKSFPDSLDLLVSSVEAGLGIDAAFRRVATEIEQAAPALAREYQLVNNEISAGVPRVDALRRLEVRTGLDEIRSLVNMLAQAERFGTSIAASLRVHANITRQKRMSAAEEKAAKVSPKLTIVMILFLLPVLKMILMGPAIIKVIRMMSGRQIT